MAPVQTTTARQSEEARLTELGAAEAVAHIARGELTAERYAGALLAQCRRAHALNAFISLEPARVLEAARGRDEERRRGVAPGPLFGLPIPIKDSINTQDYRTTAGTPALREFRPAADAPLVAALRAAGAVVLGKNNMHELSYGWTSNNVAFGAVRNPYGLAHIPGGSSGGTAAAIAARLAPLGVAEDTEGSIRVPAAFCGVLGLRPTTGRYPTGGCVPISPLFDQTGALARRVRDLLLFDSAVTGDWTVPPAVPLRGLRLGVVRDYWFADLDDEVRRLTDSAFAQLAHEGVELVESALPGLARLIGLTTRIVQNHDVRPALARYLADYAAGIGFDELFAQASADIRRLFRRDVLPDGARLVCESAYAAARDLHLPALRRLFGDYFAKTGAAAIAFPAAMTTAPRIGVERTLQILGKQVPFATAVARNIAPGSTAGLPCLAVPIGVTTYGLPVALEFDAPARADRDLLGLGLSLEALFGPLPPPGFPPPA